ncbi:E3 SUMO-protein ligase NSE2 [Aplysia californica]|uniref:E3 SUMO-protein ligase NSE2 n=1 Tax=Aplysia californica TaxID=6500 RepID=A0ABM0K489_APLCA|nr:E3 SUMO-protein ligase NSE2 [Aplysia californica]XP_005108377.1 E3 SUMO-protein ligase NSE2 [Aplysia californica]
MAGRHQTRELDSDLHILEQRILQHIGSGMDSTIDVVSNIAEYCEGDVKLRQDARTIMADYVQMEAEVKQYIAALNHVKSMSSRSEDEVNPRAEFDNKMTQIQSQGDVDVEGHPKFQAMEEQFVNVEDIEAELETLKSNLLGETEDDEVALTQTEVNIKCPYTGKNMVDPVRNTICGHVFDRDGIMGHIRAKKARAKCPVGGCGNTQPIKPEHLVEHTDLKRYIMLLAKQQR